MNASHNIIGINITLKQTIRFIQRIRLYFKNTQNENCRSVTVSFIV